MPSSSYYGSSSSSSADFDLTDLINFFLDNDAGTFFGFSTTLFGLIVCFFGLKLFKCMMFVIGFCVGFGVGLFLGLSLAGDDNQGANVAAILAMVLGIAGGFIALWCRKVVYFLFGCSLGGILSLALNVFILARTNPDGDDALNTLFISTIILSLLGGIVAILIGE